MQADEGRLRLARPFVDVVHPEAFVAMQVVQISRRVAPVRQVGEPFVGGAKNLQYLPPVRYR